MIVEFGEWLPDLPSLNNPGSITINNCIPAGKSYEPIFSLVDITDDTNALDSYPRGSIHARVPSTGDEVNIVGTETALYRFDSPTWTDISKAGGYALNSANNWEFVQYGIYVIGVNIDTNPQVYDIEAGGLFADLGGSPPKARYIDVVKDFVVLGNTIDATDGAVPYRVRWSALGDSTSWTPSAVTQADYQDLNADNGWITGVIGGDYGIIFQEKAITRMDYIGSPVVFQFNQVEINNGTQIPGSIIRVGSLIYFIGIDGFYVFDGNHSYPIGSEKIDDFFINDFDAGFPDRVSVAVDYPNNVIIWSYPGAGSLNGQPNRVIFYNYAPNIEKRWSGADIEMSHLSNTYSIAIYNMDNMDPDFPNLDEIVPSFDSRFWTGNQIIVSAFSDEFKLQKFAGPPLTATIVTPEVQLSEGERTNLIRVKPLIETNAAFTGSVTVEIGTRNLQSEEVTYTAAITLDSTGEAKVRSNARFHRMRVTVNPGTYDPPESYDGGKFIHAIGFEVLEMRKAGVR